MFDPSTLNEIIATCLLSTNSLFVWNQFSFLDEQKNRCIFRYNSMKSVKPPYKLINKMSVSSISTDWSIQSILIKSDFLIFIDLSIDKSMTIFIDWLLRVYMYGSVNSKCAHPLPPGIYCPNVFCFVLFCFWKSCKCPKVGPGSSYKNPMVG